MLYIYNYDSTCEYHGTLGFLEWISNHYVENFHNGPYISLRNKSKHVTIIKRCQNYQFHDAWNLNRWVFSRLNLIW